ncbi:MAG: ubiquinone/menaquinone biosynthesis methyltransferase [Candidatus Ancillula sp.]|nr:ubiquinone/menaquinone biosynthesis methyltransferase [Candidatus Ancillula sp.]
MGNSPTTTVDFDTIAKRYDLINAVISLGFVKLWHRRFIKLIKSNIDLTAVYGVLDVACGTGVSTKYLARLLSTASSKSVRIRAFDISKLMVEKAKKKNLQNIDNVKVQFSIQDASLIACKDSSQDLICISFGLRNLLDPARSLGEFYRVLKNGKYLAILEFSQPYKIVQPFTRLYIKHIMWRLACLFGGKHSDYVYLANSVDKWYGFRELEYMGNLVGFKTVSTKRFFLGQLAVHIFKKEITTNYAKPLKSIDSL